MTWKDLGYLLETLCPITLNNCNENVGKCKHLFGLVVTECPHQMSRAKQVADQGFRGTWEPKLKTTLKVAPPSNHEILIPPPRVAL